MDYVWTSGIEAYPSACSSLRCAWEAARDSVHRAQVVSESETAHSSTHQTYNVNDRVCRLLPPSSQGNKLQYIYAGPYRVSEVLSEGRYRLTDLENKMLDDVFDVSQLRAYRTVVDASELCPDEFLVDELMSHRGQGRQRQFQVKWRGYPRSQATWEPRSELMRRCADMVREYEAGLASSTRARRNAPPPSGTAPVGGTAESARPPRASPSQYESDDVPSIARFARGRWEYARYVATPRGRSLRWFQPSAFTESELDSAHFHQLREAASAGQADVAAVIQWELNGVPRCSPSSCSV